MATLENAARSAACDAVVDLIDVAGPGTMVFETAADAEVATLTFSATAFGAAANGVATAASITSDTSAAGGVIEHCSFYSGTPTKILEATVATSNEEITISSLTVGAGDTVSCSSLTVTMPAS